MDKIQRKDIKSILVIHIGADSLRGQIESFFPDVLVNYADNSDAVISALQTHQPDAVFAISLQGISYKCQHTAAHYPSVKWYHVGGSGIDQLLPWSATDTLVTNCTGVLARYLSEMVMAGILSLNTHLPIYQKQQQNKTWELHQFKPICDQTLLVVGLGAIGGWVAHNAKALGMKVLATRRSDTPHASVDELFSSDKLSDVLPLADVVSIHLRLDKNTRHLFNDEMLAHMKPGAMLLNTSRGGVINEQALIDALQSGQVGSAFLDVFEKEPLPQDSPLWSMDNVIVTPHTADNVYDFEKMYLQLFCDNITNWRSGKELINLVDL